MIIVEFLDKNLEIGYDIEFENLTLFEVLKELIDEYQHIIDDYYGIQIKEI